MRGLTSWGGWALTWEVTMLDLIRDDSALDLPLRYDYSQIAEEHREKVRSAARDIKSRERRAAMDIVEIGRALKDVQERLPHGQFLPWIETEFGWQRSMAYNFMAVADKLPKFGNLDGFGLSALYVLSAPSVPDEVIEEAKHIAANGQKVTHGVAKALVDKSKPPKPAAAIDLPDDLAALGRCSVERTPGGYYIASIVDALTKYTRRDTCGSAEQAFAWLRRAAGLAAPPETPAQELARFGREAAASRQAQEWAENPTPSRPAIPAEDEPGVDLDGALDALYTAVNIYVALAEAYPQKANDFNETRLDIERHIGWLDEGV